VLQNLNIQQLTLVQSCKQRFIFGALWRMQWLPRQQQQQQQQGLPRAHTTGSAANRGFFALQGLCKDPIRRLFDMQRIMSESGPGVMAGPNGETQEMMFQKAIQLKNECFARALCPAQYVAAYECILDPARVKGGKCEDALKQVILCMWVCHGLSESLDRCRIVEMHFGKVH
jgi:hypothetical protein